MTPRRGLLRYACWRRARRSSSPAACGDRRRPATTAPSSLLAILGPRGGAAAGRRIRSPAPDIDIEVEQLTWATGFEKIQASLASGTQPDVCELGSTWLPRFSYEGVLEDVTPVYEAERDSFLMWESALWNGRVYGLPWVQGSRALFINRSLFKRAGLDPERPPQTWDELLYAAQKISALGTGIYGFGQNIGELVLYKKFMAFAWGNGGDVFDESGTVVLNSPAVLEALEFYLKLAPFSLQEKQEVLDQYSRPAWGCSLRGVESQNYQLEATSIIRWRWCPSPRPTTARTRVSPAPRCWSSSRRRRAKRRRSSSRAGCKHTRRRKNSRSPRAACFPPRGRP
jgi:hypothetical protein